MESLYRILPPDYSIVISNNDGMFLFELLRMGEFILTCWDYNGFVIHATKYLEGIKNGKS